MANILKLLEERPQFHSTAGASNGKKQHNSRTKENGDVNGALIISVQWQPQKISVIPMGKIS